MSSIEHDLRFMTFAIEKAREGVENGQSPFGALIARNGEIISCEHNRVWETNDSTAHAEIVAIRTACRKLETIDLSGSVIYCTCEPCPMCFSAIHWAKIYGIIYGVSIEDVASLGFSELPISCRKMKELTRNAIEIAGGIMKSENTDLLELWKQLPNRPY